MNIRKFTAASAREALKEIRSELGEEAVILSNRKTEHGVEIHAMANDEMVRLSSASTPVLKHPAKPKTVDIASVYQAYEAEEADDEPFLKLGNKAKPQPVMPPAQPVVQPAVQSAEPVEEALISKPPQPFISTPAGEAAILGEIKSMHSMLQKQIETLSWNNVQQRDPQRAGMLRRMLNAGFSTLLARQLLDKMPAGNEKGESWIKQVLKRNLRVAGIDDDIVVRGGVYALIGPTGVGKTTTTAKLAARAVVRYGADKVALLTTDSYRIGAYEQLKIYGKILGVAVHAVKGADDLRLTLAALRHKHLVLIDTVGMGQRDERVVEQGDMFDAAGVQRLLVLNSTSGGDTLEDVVRMYYSNKVIGCIATKLDEAANLGAILDVVVRHRLVMYFMANGQRVPEDLHLVNIDILLHRAFKPAEEKTPFTLEALEFPTIMADSGNTAVPSGEVTYAL
ncbi:flagellar biosynthesis protein FlhF [Gallionella capsiferriformans]|jgi:flagellar biosynthesis protein FlhF|uniref:Flagellar biosynthesis protein FlhF n=1 Tax=Gallionella capsiferriformans (strain ES-2) TaxID=395494 RepID=D9SEW5_GALCS|nr:flagellar biosynthesis protein FlhF [Gallionella capsiferriformans]ADL55062.1 flagellar biosynthetic protein FlhF [Gallionella capsiferriformans ES-2]